MEVSEVTLAVRPRFSWSYGVVRLSLAMTSAFTYWEDDHGREPGARVSRREALRGSCQRLASHWSLPSDPIL